MISKKFQIMEFKTYTCILISIFIVHLAGCEKHNNYGRITSDFCSGGVVDESQRAKDLAEISQWEITTRERLSTQTANLDEKSYLEELQHIISNAKAAIADGDVYHTVQDRHGRLHGIAVYNVDAKDIDVDYIFTRPHFDQHRIPGAGIATLITLFSKHPNLQTMKLNAMKNSLPFYERFGFIRIDNSYFMTVTRDRLIKKYQEWYELRKAP